MLHKDAAQLVSAQADLQRYAALVPEGFQTRQIYDQQIAQVGQLRASIEGDQAQIDAAQLNLDYAKIRSPIEGRTGARLVDLGNMVRAATGSDLVTITQLRPIFVSFTVPQQVLRVVRQNQTIAAAAGSRVFAGRPAEAGGRHPDADRQPSRSDDRHRAAESDLPE